MFGEGSKCHGKTSETLPCDWKHAGAKKSSTIKL